jgi:maltooligosyltrehalose trehalohydrolase
MPTPHRLGATYLGDNRCHFLVWAPRVETVAVHVVAPTERTIPLARDARGYHAALVDDVEPGSLYRYRLDNTYERPDPASRLQPQDVHGPSAVVDATFAWQDQAWCGLQLPDYIIYELHVGTFTQPGTFDAIIPHLDELREVGITAIELMPVAQFPGTRNWGYDGVYLYAVHHPYGGPEGLKRLVNACHQGGLAVILDVVYNHLGPEGNYLYDFAPYFTDHYKTPWGWALNFDGAESDEVRRYFLENALYWVTECHIDALRLDAVHAIADQSAYPFLAELADVVHTEAARLNRRVHLFAESSLNDAKIIRPSELGGYGHDGQWSDDFHHALHTLLTGEREGYYQDFGAVAHLTKALTDGFVYSGQYSPYRKRRHGNSSRQVPAQRFVVCAQNHDQVGNRMLGERLSRLVSFEQLKLAAGVLLLSPFIPLLFMGEEYGETAPFPYFISHLDQELVEAVRRGRREEFAAFAWQAEPPDPQGLTVFQQAKLRHQLRQQGEHAILQALYQELLRLRRESPALAHLSKETLEVWGLEQPRLVCVRRWYDRDDAWFCAHFGAAAVTLTVPLPPGTWSKRLDSAETRWSGPGSPIPAQYSDTDDRTLTLPPYALVLFTRSEEE